MFKMTTATVHSIISKMIMSEELHASLDQVANVVKLHRVQPTRLQYLSLQYAEKVTALVEGNERTFDVRTGFSKDDQRKDKRTGKGGQTGGNTGGRDRFDRTEQKDGARPYFRNTFRDNTAGGQQGGSGSGSNYNRPLYRQRDGPRGNQSQNQGGQQQQGGGGSGSGSSAKRN